MQSGKVVPDGMRAHRNRPFRDACGHVWHVSKLDPDGRYHAIIRRLNEIDAAQSSLADT